MRAVIALAALLGGCATSWIAVQAGGGQRLLDEGIRETSVPLPGVDERLNVSLPLDGGSLQCSTDQRATNTVYHSAFRYGKRWKIASGLMALTEGALAASFILTRDEKPEYILYGGFLGVDALITTALFFIPRKEVYRKEDRPALTHIRSDCPDGTTLAIGEQRFPVDAAGRIGEVGDAALDAWFAQPTGELVLEAAGQARRFEIGPAERCTWQRAHTTSGPACYPGTLLTVLVSIAVPAGTLTVAARDAHEM